jgi:outer membrane cobalamin receptor
MSAPPAFLTDSSDTRPLHEVVVKAYEQNRKLIDVGAPIGVVSKASLDRFQQYQHSPGMNMIPASGWKSARPAATG